MNENMLREKGCFKNQKGWFIKVQTDITISVYSRSTFFHSFPVEILLTATLVILASLKPIHIHEQTFSVTNIHACVHDAEMLC